MNLRLFVNLISFVVLALFFGFLGWVTESTIIRWAAPAVALALISVGLGVNSLTIASHVNRKMEKIEIAIAGIENIHREMQKEQKEQSSSPLVPTLQAFSQLYLDYLEKQQHGQEQQESNSTKTHEEAENEANY